MTAIPLRDPTESEDPLHIVFDKRMIKEWLFIMERTANCTKRNF